MSNLDKSYSPELIDHYIRTGDRLRSEAFYNAFRSIKKICTLKFVRKAPEFRGNVSPRPSC